MINLCLWDSDQISINLLQSLLALEPQVRAAQVQRPDPRPPAGRGRLCRVLSPELQQHHLPQEHEVPLVIRDPVIIDPGDLVWHM